MERKNIIVLQELKGNPPTELNPFQTFLTPHLDLLILMWWFVWVGVLLIVCVRFFLLPILRKVYPQSKLEHDK